MISNFFDELNPEDVVKALENCEHKWCVDCPYSGKCGELFRDSLLLLGETHVFYSDRVKIAKAFEKWAEKNKASKCHENLIAFLWSHRIINTFYLKKFIKEIDRNEP